MTHHDPEHPSPESDRRLSELLGGLTDLDFERVDPPAGLLGEVVAVVHVAVQVAQLGPDRQRGLLHRAALAAAIEVLVRPGAMAGGGARCTPMAGPTRTGRYRSRVGISG